MLKETYCTPFLPQNRVLRAFVSGLMPQNLIDELMAMMIKPYILGKSNNMSGELAYHPDILVNNFRKGMWLCENDAKYIPKNLPIRLFRETETELSDLYPFDCPFNNFSIGHALVCGKSADYLIRAYARYEDKLEIYVPQNYTKCCTILVNDHAVITSDYYIGKTLRKFGFDVLTIKDSDEIGLKGYSHGLIGGCAAKLSADTLAFTGDISRFKYGEDIRSFCINHKVYTFSLSSESLYDYGGILPITELTDNNKEDVSELFLQAEERPNNIN